MRVFQKPLLFTFLTGMVIGVLYLNIFARDYFMMSGIFNSHYLEEYSEASIDAKVALPYLVMMRIIPLTMLWLMAYSKLNKVITIIVLLWTGFLGGMYLALGAVQLNALGVIFCALGLFPQMIFYIPAYIVLIIYVYNYPSSKWNMAKVVTIIGCLICGLFSEVQINPELLKWMIEKIS